jgi:hypothetical protein
MSILSEESEYSASSTSKLQRSQSSSRQGYLDICEDSKKLVAQLPFSSWFGQSSVATKELIFTRRWVLLRDCWMYVFSKHTDVNLDNVSQQFTYDLRGSTCQIHSGYERTLRLETQSIALFASDARSRRVLLLRAKSNSELRLWKESIDTSSMWDLVLRAWSFQETAAADISASLTDGAIAGGGADDSNATPKLIELLDPPPPLEIQSTVTAAASPTARAPAPTRSAGRRRQTKSTAAAARPPSPSAAARRGRRRAPRAGDAAGDDDGGRPFAGALDELAPADADGGGGGGGGAPSSDDEAEERAREARRAALFVDAFCARDSDDDGGSDGDDLGDLDSALRTRDELEEAFSRARRLRRLARRRGRAACRVYTWGDGFNYCLGHGAHRDER